MRRVCHITTVHPSPFDVRIFWKECRTLAQAGYEVFLIAPHDREEIREGIRILPLPPVTSRLARMSLRVQQALSLAREVRAHLYHVHSPEFLPAVPFLRWKRGVRIVYDSHEDAPRSLWQKPYLPGWLQGPLSAGLEMVERVVVSWLDAILTADDFVAQRFRRWTRVPVLPIYNFPRIEELWIEVPWDRRIPWTAVYIGGISYFRGIHVMVQAMELIRSSRARLELCGNFWDSRLKESVSAMPGWEYVQFHGFCSRARVRDVLQRVQVGLIPLLPHPNYVEALPVKLFEYMCAGIPVVVSGFPLWRRIVRNHACGLSVRPGSAEELARALQWLWRHPHIAEQMGRNGQIAVRKYYSWEREARKLLRLYRWLLGS